MSMSKKGAGAPASAETVCPDSATTTDTQHLPPRSAASTTRIRYEDNTTAAFDDARLSRFVASCAKGHTDVVDVTRIAEAAARGLYDGISADEVHKLAISAASNLIGEDPAYARIAARMLMRWIEKEVEREGITSFSDSIAVGRQHGLIGEECARLVERYATDLDAAVKVAAPTRNDLFVFFGLRTVADRYLLRHPESRRPIEVPQYWFMRVACGLADDLEEALEVYDLLSTLSYLPGSPTLFNSGTAHTQMSSCYLLDSPEDSLEGIYDGYKNVAQLSKWAGGIGIAYHRIRARGSLIRSTNGYSNGLVAWLKTLDSSVASVNQCFAPNTLVHTAEGTKPIKEVGEGDLVLGISGEYRKVTEHYTYRETGPMVEIDVKHSVRPVQVTTQHPFWALQGIPMETSRSVAMAQVEGGKATPAWVDAGNLSKGDYVGQVIPTEVVPVENFTEDDARLYGLLLGNGQFDGKEWGLSGSPTTKPATLEFVRQYLSSRGIHFWEENAGHGETYTRIRWSAGRGVKRNAENGRFTGAGEATLPFDRADIYDVSGAKAISRRLSHLPRHQALALVRGLIESDGNVSRGAEITFCSTSEALAEGIRYQMLRLGAPTSGQYREREASHEGTRASGTTASFEGVVKVFDIRIPAIEELAVLVGASPLTKFNWLEFGGCVWSRVREVRPIKKLDEIHDLKVEGVESYMTTGALVHNGGRRKGACCVYLESWHADIEEFLELRDNTGDEARRAHNLNLANWVPDLFMQRVEDDTDWSLFDPKDVPHFCDIYGREFEEAYLKAEQEGLAKKTMPARKLYQQMARTLAQTGNGWMTFKDRSNLTSNQTSAPGTVVHSSNLCTEIIEVTSSGETAVCNLGSINLERLVYPGSGFMQSLRERIDWERLGDTVRTAVTYLDRVVDRNFYPIESAARSNARWRPVGLGCMGLQDVFFKLGLPFDSEEAAKVSQWFAEEIYFHALSRSIELAELHGAHEAFPLTRAAKGELQFDYWEAKPTMRTAVEWDALRQRMKRSGLRNSLLIAIAPTATIASIAGCYECIEPQVSNVFKRETLSGEFMQVNPYLVEDLKKHGLWTPEVRDAIKQSDGSIQRIEAIPAKLRHLYRTCWELKQKVLIDMAADRGAFIDQSQSLNLFMEAPTIGKVTSMYSYAWRKGLKTTYYLRSRPATNIRKTTLLDATGQTNKRAASAPTEVMAPVVEEAQGAKPSAEGTSSASASGEIDENTPLEPTVPACTLETPGSCESCGG